MATCTISTGALYRTKLTRFAAWYRQTYGEDPEPHLLTEEEAREYRAHLLGVRRLAASTVNLCLSALRGLARHCGNPMAVADVRQVQAPIDILTARELGRLLRAVRGDRWLDKRNMAMLALMARAGLRVGEVSALDVADVGIKPRSGWVRIRRGKGLKARRVPLSLQARKEIIGCLDCRPLLKGPALFVSKSGKRIKPRIVRYVVTQAADVAKIQKAVSPHILRHTFATRFLERTHDLAALRDILGHANIATTSQYLHPTAERLQRLVESV